MRRRLLIRHALRAALALAVLAGAGAAPLTLGVRAQDLPEPGDGFTWERVGEHPIDAYDLAFGPDSTLWAAAGDGPYRLDLSEGFPGEWVLVSDFSGTEAILPLGTGGPDGDTLVTSRGYIHRSTDGGQTWEVVHDNGGEALYEIPAGLPHAGRILVGDNTGLPNAIAYSDDRAASFTLSVVPGEPGIYGGADDFVALPPDSDHPGRILAAGDWGVNISDDGGETFRKSGLWQAVYYVGEAINVVEQVGLVEQPRGEVGAVMGGRVSGQSGARVWASIDGGQTWEPGDGQQLLEGPPNYGSPKAVLALGGSSVLVVLRGGTVYRSDDAGETWEAVGRAPEISTAITVRSAALGPDRRLYVGLLEAGVPRAWVYRTAEVHLPVASEPSPSPEESLGLEVVPNPFRGEATVAFTVGEASRVRVSVYDVLGREVAVLAGGRLEAGRHEATLDGAALASGLYLIRATVETEGDERQVVARVTVLR